MGGNVRAGRRPWISGSAEQCRTSNWIGRERRESGDRRDNHARPGAGRRWAQRWAHGWTRWRTHERPRRWARPLARRWLLLPLSPPFLFLFVRSPLLHLALLVRRVGCP